MGSKGERASKPRIVRKKRARFRYILPIVGTILLGPMSSCLVKAETLQKLQRQNEEIKVAYENFKKEEIKAKRASKACIKENRKFLNGVLKFIALPEFLAIRSKDIKAVDAELKKLFGVKELNQIPKTFESVLKIFDRTSSITYKMHFSVVQFPAQTLKLGSGDCDDKATTLSLMLNRVFPNSTRAVSVEVFKEEKWVNHQYLQFDLSQVPEINVQLNKEDDKGASMIEFMIDNVKQRYKISDDFTWQLVNGGIETSNRGFVEDPGKPGSAANSSTRIWFTLDATAELPGGMANKNKNTRLTRIQYPHVERMMRMEKEAKKE